MPNYADNNFTLVSSADNTKHARFSIAGLTAATERTITIPDSSGTIVTMENLGRQDFDGTLGLISPEIAFSVVFYDNSSYTGSGTYLAIPVTPLGATVILPNDTGTLPSIVAPSSATVNKTGQTASIATTTTYTTTHAGLYRMSAYAVFTAVTTPGNLTISAIYTDPQQAQTVSFNRNNTLAYTVAGSHVEGELTFYSTTASLIRFSTTLTGIGTYNVYIRVESLT